MFFRIIRHTRLWVLAAAFFAGGVLSRIYVESMGAGIDAYYVSVVWQWDFFGAGLLVLLAWIVFQARGAQQPVGCGLWIVLLLTSGIAILTSIPK